MAETVRALDREYKKEWEGLRHPLLGGDSQKMSEESIRRSVDILRKCLYKTRAIISMSNDVVWRLLRVY